MNKSNATSTLINSLTNNLVNINRINAFTLISLISAPSENEYILVTTIPNTAIAPAEKPVNVPFKVNLSSTTKCIPILFETEETELPESLETVNDIATVIPGPNHQLRIPVLNYNIIFQKNTTIGRIEHNTVKSYLNHFMQN